MYVERGSSFEIEEALYNGLYDYNHSQHSTTKAIPLDYFWVFQLDAISEVESNVEIASNKSSKRKDD